MGDISVLVNTDNPIETAMLSGVYDRELYRILKRFVSPGDYCIDIGANVGPVTLMLAKLVGPRGHVVAVEPGPPYYERLRANLCANPGLQDRVTTVNIGLSDSTESLRWVPDPKHPYNAGLWMPHHDVGVTVPVETLDRMVEQIHLRRIDFIKIDVEGMEFQVINGGIGALTEFEPIVLFEALEVFRTLHRQDSFAEIERLFDSLDYGLYGMESSGKLYPVTAVNLPFNTLAIPRRRDVTTRR
jgi:FkbM family methyltransferase